MGLPESAVHRSADSGAYSETGEEANGGTHNEADSEGSTPRDAVAGNAVEAWHPPETAKAESSSDLR